MTRTFHTLYVIALAGLILTGIAQGRGMMRHGIDHSAPPLAGKDFALSVESDHV
jgi:hypothetical protein